MGSEAVETQCAAGGLIKRGSTMSGRKRTISLNCSLAVPTTSSTTSLNGSNTPNTPEILNAIINISSEHLQTFDANQANTLKCEEKNDPAPEYSPNNPVPSPSYSECSENSSNSSIPSSLSPPYDSTCCYQQSQASSFLNPNISVQRYHPQFIKEGLKMKVKQKIKEEPILEDGKLEVEDIKQENEDLTIEDEERRRRRRERNKVAATKCRNKKKERTTLLIAEGEVLEIQNECLKDEMMRLELEHKHLTTMLSKHEPSCGKKIKREDSNEKLCYEDKSSFYDVNANKKNSIHINNNNNNNVYSDCKYKVKEEDRFYENDNSVSDASPVGDDIYLDDFSES